jgi:hypothetical protein
MRKTKCPNPDHDNPYIDNCSICMPLWNNIYLCGCGSDIPMEVHKNYIVCRSCHMKVTRPKEEKHENNLR